MNTGYEQFLRRASSSLSRSCAARFACVAARSDDTLHTISAVLVLGPQESFAVEPALAEVAAGKVVAFERRVGPDKVRAVLDAIIQGHADSTLLETSHPVRLCRPEASGNVAFLPTTTLEPPTRRLDGYGPAYGGHEFIATYGHVTDALNQEEQLDVRQRLLTSAIPVEDISDLARHFRIAPNVDNYRRIALVAPTWTRIDSARAQPDGSTIEVRVSTLWPDGLKDARVAAIPQDSGVRSRPTAPVEQIRVSDDHCLATQHGTAQLPWSPEQGPVRVILAVGDQPVDAVIAGIPNGRLRTHEFFDPDCGLLRARLGSQRPDRSKEFESGVATLLHLCGFGVAVYAGGKLPNEVDVVAFLDNDPVLFCECTTTPPPEEKIRTLAARASACMRALGVTTRRHRLAISTPMETAFSLEDHKRARAHAVHLLRASDLSQLLEMARRSASPETVLSYISQPIPGIGF